MEIDLELLRRVFCAEADEHLGEIEELAETAESLSVFAEQVKRLMDFFNTEPAPGAAAAAPPELEPPRKRPRPSRKAHTRPSGEWQPFDRPSNGRGPEDAPGDPG